VVTEIVDQTSKKDIGEMIASRAERGMQLYLSKRQLIVRTGEDTYSVPGSGTKHYRVEYGGEVEGCECTDFGVHRGELACKHLTAVGLLYARRRESPGVSLKAGGHAGGRRLKELEARLAHELMDDDERQELHDDIKQLRDAVL
jgi:uncharacterized Zn finger protein